MIHIQKYHTTAHLLYKQECVQPMCGETYYFKANTTRGGCCGWVECILMLFQLSLLSGTLFMKRDFVIIIKGITMLNAIYDMRDIPQAAMTISGSRLYVESWECSIGAIFH